MSLYRTVTTLSVLAVSIGSAYASIPSRGLTLAEQAATMPSDFRSHFFNVPISARVMIDGKLLGDANIVLDDAEHVQIISFIDVADSFYDKKEQEHWLAALSSPSPLGMCSKACPAELVAIDYNLNNAQLSLLTSNTTGNAASLWYPLPENGSSGMLLSTQFNASGGQKYPSAMNLQSSLEGALGDWTTVNQFQIDRSSTSGTPMRHAVTAMYLERENGTTFFRGGMFMPDNQGVLRLPYNLNGVTTLAGMMTGNSYTRLKDDDFSSQFPIWVTANREGVAEIYRDGALINSQPVTPGLQMLNTAPLPTGIYEVEIRIMENGRETSQTTETVIKSTDWRVPGQRLRWNLFAGRHTSLWNSQYNDRDGQLATGISMNYLLHPEITTGLALQNIGNERQAGISLDWQAGRQVQLYSNLQHSSLTGRSINTQALWQHQQGNVALSHNRSWFIQEDDWNNSSTVYRRSTNEYTTALSSTYRLNRDNSVNGRVTHYSNNNGLGVDLGYSTNFPLAGIPVSWRLAAFDRPYNDSSNVRNRGGSLTASFQIGTAGRSANASIGSRSSSRGSNSLYGSVSLNQQWENSIIKESSATVTQDRYGTGFITYNNFDMPVATGSFWGQHSSADKSFSGGVNLGSVVAIGQGKITVSREMLHHQGAGMIVDVISDDNQAQLVALNEGNKIPLTPGRNFIPVDAWKPGAVQLDFPGSDAPPLKISPQYLDYHLIRGGVSSHEVHVMKTVTVMGRLVDHEGKTLGGARIVNNAGRTVSESDGMFTLEIHENKPVLSIEHPSGIQCEIHLNPETQKRDEIIFAGNLICEGSALTEQTNRHDSRQRVNQHAN